MITSYYSNTRYGKLRTKQTEERKRNREERRKQAYNKFLKTTQ